MGNFTKHKESKKHQMIILMTDFPQKSLKEHKILNIIYLSYSLLGNWEIWTAIELQKKFQHSLKSKSYLSLQAPVHSTSPQGFLIRTSLVMFPLYTTWGQRNTTLTLHNWFLYIVLISFTNGLHLKHQGRKSHELLYIVKVAGKTQTGPAGSLQDLG